VVEKDGASSTASRPLAESAEEAHKPRLHGGSYCRQIPLEAVISGHLDHGALPVGGRDPEPVARSLHDQSRNRNPVQFRETARARRRPQTLRRLQREGQAHHRDRACSSSCPAGNPCPPTNDLLPVAAGRVAPAHASGKPPSARQRRAGPPRQANDARRRGRAAPPSRQTHPLPARPPAPPPGPAPPPHHPHHGQAPIRPAAARRDADRPAPAPTTTSPRALAPWSDRWAERSPRSAISGRRRC
jgi:hypothetical protein